MGDFLTLVIIGLLFAVGSIVKRAMRAAGQQDRGRPQRGREFRASRDKIREFLEEIRQGRQATAPAPEPPAVPLEMLPPVAPARAVQPPPTPVQQAKPRRAKKRKKAGAESLAAMPAQPSAPPAQAAAPPAFRLPKTDMQKAIVWSEIIGRPVSMRKRIGHRPPRLEG